MTTYTPDATRSVWEDMNIFIGDALLPWISENIAMVLALLWYCCHGIVAMVTYIAPGHVRTHEHYYCNTGSQCDRNSLALLNDNRLGKSLYNIQQSQLEIG